MGGRGQTHPETQKAKRDLSTLIARPLRHHHLKVLSFGNFPWRSQTFVIWPNSAVFTVTHWWPPSLEFPPSRKVCLQESSFWDVLLVRPVGQTEKPGASATQPRHLRHQAPGWPCLFLSQRTRPDQLEVYGQVTRMPPYPSSLAQQHPDQLPWVAIVTPTRTLPKSCKSTLFIFVLQNSFQKRKWKLEPNLQSSQQGPQILGLLCGEGWQG